MTISTGRGYMAAMESTESDGVGTELSDQDRVLLVFDYLGPLAIVSLLASRREFVKWHAKQGLLLFLAAMVIYVVLKPLWVLMDWLLPFLGELFWACMGMIGVGLLLLMMFCVVRALEGERFKIPILGELADRI